MKKLKLFFINLLLPGIDEDFPEEPEDFDEPEEELDESEEELDEPEEELDEPVKPVSRIKKAIIETRKRAQDAESERDRVKAELEAERSRNRQPAQPNQDEVLWKQEEAVLNNPDAEEWQKYAVQSNRNSRKAEASSREALFFAHDGADKAKFGRYAVDKPKTYDRYKDAVEEHVRIARSNGHNPSREDVLYYLVGQDNLKGKLITKKSATKTGGRAAPTRVKSDVPSSGRQSLSDSEKRAKRLDGVKI